MSTDSVRNQFVNRIKSIFILFALFLGSCGNPGIIRYLAPQNHVISKDITDIRNPAHEKFKILEKNGVILYLKNASYMDIEQILKTDVLDNISFRIPSLTYLEFILENNSIENIDIDFFNVQLSDSDDNHIPVITRETFYKNYTSVAYRNFNYEKIFALYIHQYQGKSPKRGFFYDKYSPGKTGIIKPGYSALQIVPYHRISERRLDYSLNFSISGLEENIRIPLRFIINRTDQPDLKK